MNRPFYIGIAALFLVCVIFSSCKKDNPTTEEPNTLERPDVHALRIRTIDTKIVLNNVWHSNNQRKDRDSDSLLFMCYLFGPNDTCIINKGKFVRNGLNVIFEEATALGAYKIYSVVNWYPSEYIGIRDGQINMNTLFPLFSDREIYFGSKDFTVIDTVTNYSVQIPNNPIISRLSIAINNVPSYIDSIAIVLPNQANSFKFDGTFHGDTQREIFHLNKSGVQDTNGSYTWTISEQIVLPSATIADTMCVNVIASSTRENLDTIYTSTSRCCTPGRHILLRAKWDAFFTATTITLNSWNDTILEGEFEL